GPPAGAQPPAPPMPSRTVAPGGRPAPTGPATSTGRAGPSTGRAAVPPQRGGPDSPLWTMTDRGLPRRPADETTVAMSNAAAPVTDTPDPESVRARLSSLSNGIAAAQRGDV